MSDRSRSFDRSNASRRHDHRNSKSRHRDHTPEGRHGGSRDESANRAYRDRSHDSRHDRANDREQSYHHSTQNRRDTSREYSRSSALRDTKLEIHPLLKNDGPSSSNISNAATSIMPSIQTASTLANVRAAQKMTQSFAETDKTATKIKENPYLAHSKHRQWIKAADRPFIDRRIPGKAAVHCANSDGSSMYILPNSGSISASSSLSSSSNGRRSQMLFHRPGKFIEQAEALRLQEELKELDRSLRGDLEEFGLQHQLISEQTSNIGAQGTIPIMEWWDLAFFENQVNGIGTSSTASMVSSALQDIQLSSHSNSHLSEDLHEEKVIEAVNRWNWELAESKIDNLVQRPAVVRVHQPSTDTLQLKLTSAEQKKLRRQRRLKEQQDIQEQIKLGLMAPPPQKIRIASLPHMIASTNSVSGPSSLEKQAMEAAVQRRMQHQETNTLRSIQAAQEREENLEAQIMTKFSRRRERALFVIRYGDDYDHPCVLSMKLRYKLTMNAKQNNLCGVLCFAVNPSDQSDSMLCHKSLPSAVLILEGAAVDLARYKRLLLNRIQWTCTAEMPSDHSIGRCDVLWEGHPVVDQTKPFPHWLHSKDVMTAVDAADIFAQFNLVEHWRLVSNSMKL